jgi:excinuclease ABC subunit B
MYDLRPEENRLAADPIVQYMNKPQLEAMTTETRRKMENAAQDLDFLQAARYRDELAELKAKVEKMEKEAV